MKRVFLAATRTRKRAVTVAGTAGAILGIVLSHADDIIHITSEILLVLLK